MFTKALFTKDIGNNLYMCQQKGLRCDVYVCVYVCDSDIYVIQTHNGILFSREKGYSLICEKTDELTDHYTKC